VTVVTVAVVAVVTMVTVVAVVTEATMVALARPSVFTTVITGKTGTVPLWRQLRAL
jgi:hypothetical protein